MPLFNCKECGLEEAGYWHCETIRQDRRSLYKFVFTHIAIYGGASLIIWLLVRYL